jgi:hypothetical protein
MSKPSPGIRVLGIEPKSQRQCRYSTVSQTAIVESGGRDFPVRRSALALRLRFLKHCPNTSEFFLVDVTLRPHFFKIAGHIIVADVACADCAT